MVLTEGLLTWGKLVYGCLQPIEIHPVKESQSMNSVLEILSGLVECI